ncbi:hypothetical protein ACIQCN_07025 [Pseudarthrobacter sp. NPDC092424]|uniref:hypothetical protein n=1 Tax=Pseudarthrobacter sp. NPDC092424 TaxID=3364415 RepID=UPI00380B1997
MGIGDNIGKAAENAMEDLAGTSDPVEKSNVPEPTDPNDDVEVHSSISEGSNALEAEKQKAPGLKTGAAPGPVSASPQGLDAERSGSKPTEAIAEDGTGGTDAAAPGPGRVAGPGGLPEGDPDELRADPSEGGQDPSATATDYRTGPSGH